jgi:hypothetical protein
MDCDLLLLYIRTEYKMSVKFYWLCNGSERKNIFKSNYGMIGKRIKMKRK